MKSLIIMLTSVVLLSGCQLTRVEGEFKDVEVEMSSKGSGSSKGSFCPPGQAKKGNC
ncbi:hypothetical protein [Vibrio sp. V39_P1S14PM300]|uniref:hypothetical protein n=1 Tax=Vibrio sp. V39_P1S14PM300 TaxID=1938690 RepID=UPI001929E44B|nr:hypothetical protein [Vibrio sp. V39_P1S14PM300]